MSEAPERPPIDWDKIADELAGYGNDVAARIRHMVAENGPRVEKGEYGVDDLFSDIKTFWTNLADDVGRGVDCFNRYVVRRTDVD